MAEEKRYWQLTQEGTEGGGGGSILRERSQYGESENH